MSHPAIKSLLLFLPKEPSASRPRNGDVYTVNWLHTVMAAFSAGFWATGTSAKGSNRVVSVVVSRLS